MNQANNTSEKIFSYGTLQYETVQLSTFGRKLAGNADILSGYRMENLEIKNPEVIKTSGDTVHPILVYTGNETDQVKGTVFDITLNELHLADQYEVAEYKRIAVTLVSGITSWVYVRA